VDARAFARLILAHRAGHTLSALKNFFSSQAVHFVSLGFLSPARKEKKKRGGERDGCLAGRRA
jgi:hypothetical protein